MRGDPIARYARLLLLPGPHQGYRWRMEAAETPDGPWRDATAQEIEWFHPWISAMVSGIALERSRR